MTPGPIDSIDSEHDDIKFENLDFSLSNFIPSDILLPWKQKELNIVFQQGSKFKKLLDAYNDATDQGRGQKSLKSSKSNDKFTDLSEVSIIDYFPEFIADFIERIWPVRVKSRLEAISLVANELEEVHGYNSYKYKPNINLLFGVHEPDSNYFADKSVLLTNGRTAYKLVYPEKVAPETSVIVCLHGLLDSSYIWSDVAELLAKSQDGPKAIVLIFDFHGHGRSPWNGVPNSLDILVAQVKGLLEGLNYFESTIPSNPSNCFFF